MGVRKKKKRKIVHKDQAFYWYVKFTDDWMCAYSNPQLHIVSEDKNFIFSYQPNQQNANPFLIIKGENITGLNQPTGSWRRVKVPIWEDDQITPGFVATLLDWCFDEKKKVQLVDYLGVFIEQETR